MLLITTEDSLGTRDEFTWYVGQKSPMVSHSHVEMVIEVQADGDELAALYGHNGTLSNFKHGPVVRFFGDDAKFIVANSLPERKR